MTLVRSKLPALAAGLMLTLSFVVLLYGQAHAAVDWTAMTTGLKTEFEAAVTLVLPIVGAIVAVFLAYKAIRRFVKA